MTEFRSELRVFLDAAWFGEPQAVGTLYREVLRGAPKYAFEFDRAWLKAYPGLSFSSDLETFPGRQYLPQGKDQFGCFSDALPDRWGRLLLRRREEVEAEREGRPVRTLTSFDLLSGIDDFTRMGAFRFKDQNSEDFVNEETPLSVPPMVSLRELAEAASHIEASERRKLEPEEKWLEQLIRPGSSLGGARPKATVIDEKGELWIAKFPSQADEVDVGGWEAVAMELARRAGITVSESRLMDIGGAHRIFLTKRFDRLGEKRVHFASAMTMLGLTDGDGASTGHGYLDLVETILACSTDVESDLEEIFRRVAFSICIGNADDHFRNHGFVLTQKGWRLSPAYDLNPTVMRRQSLLIDGETDAADLKILEKSAELYFLTQGRASAIIQEVLDAMKDWQSAAARLQLPQRDIRRFEERFICA